MLTRTAYEQSGTHRRLAMEVVDDMKLGKLVKMAGFRSGVAVAQDYVSVAWHLGLGNLVRGVEKNFFAGAQFRIPVAVAQISALLLMNVIPFAGLLFGHGWIRVFAAISVLIATCFHLGVDLVMRVSSTLLPDASAWSDDLRVHGVALHDYYLTARRNRMARHLLSSRRTAQRSSLNRDARLRW